MAEKDQNEVFAQPLALFLANQRRASTEADRGLHPIGSLRSLRARDSLFHEGEPNEHLFVVLDGVLKLYKLTVDGRQQITRFFFPGQILGLEASAGFSGSAKAVTDATLIRYPRRAAEDWAQLDPDLGTQLLRVTYDNLQSASYGIAQ